jgi:PKHD-type hydroxylase
MLTLIPGVLDKDRVRQFRAQLDAADWTDGRETAGTLGAKVKQNRQLPARSETGMALGNQILGLLGRHPLFMSAALPHRIYPPLFNRYSGGEHYGLHVDGAIMPIPGSPDFLRSDLSATLFLCEPEEYEGGELTIETPFGAQQVKLPAGDLVLYPSSSLHEVTPVTRGTRTCSFFWIQSMVQHEDKRTLLFDLDQAVQAITAANLPAQKPTVLQLAGVYHNLLRHWAQV